KAQRKKAAGIRPPPFLSLLRLSAGVFYRAGFPDDRYLDLPRIFQLRLDLLHDVPRQLGRGSIVDLFRFDHDANFAPSLDRIRLIDAFEGVGDSLQLAQPLDVVVQALPPRPRTGSGNRVGRGDQRGFEGLRLIVAVVASHRVDDVLRLLVLFQQLDADVQVAAFHFVVHGLADV